MGCQENETLLSLVPLNARVLVIVSYNVLDCFLKPDRQQLHYVVTSTQVSWRLSRKQGCWEEQGKAEEGVSSRGAGETMLRK